MDLNDYAQQVRDANKNWWLDLTTGKPKDRNVGELLMLCVSELAEAMEGNRKDLMDDKLTDREMFEVEVVDCMIRLFDIAGHMIPELQEIFDEKMAFNASRADHRIENRLKDGGKRF